MSRFVVSQINADMWDTYLSNHEYCSHEQTSYFAEQYQQYGFSSVRVGITDDGSLVGGVQILYRSIPLIGKIGLITQGPIIDSDDPDVMAQLCRAIEQIAKKQGLIHIKIVPPALNNRWEGVFEDLNYSKFDMNGYDRRTICVPCSNSNEDLLKNMKSKCRYNVNLARRKGVEVRMAGFDDLPVFYDLLKLTAQRQEFPIFPLEYFQQIWKLLEPKKKINLLIAYVDDIPLAGVIITVIGDGVAHYGWGGMTNTHRKLMANHLLHWEAIQWARSIGCQYYDFGGGMEDGGVGRFKQSWNGEILDYPRSYEVGLGKYLSPGKGLIRTIRKNSRVQSIVERIEHRLLGNIPH